MTIRLSMATQEHDPGELGRRTVASGLTALVTRVAHSALLLGASVVLARLLTPGDFGVFAMAVPLGMLGTELATHSFQTAILQRPDAPRAEIAALFRFALRVNLLVAGLMIAAGLGLGRLYHEPRLVPVVGSWAALIYLLTFTGFQEALLKRAMRFPPLLLLKLAGVGLSVVAAIAAALAGAGHWALMIQVLVMEGGRAVAVQWLSRWRPGSSSGADPDQVAAMRRSWRALAGLSLAGWVNDQPDLVAVGRIGGAPVLGLYDTARRWTRYAFTEPFFSVSEVAVASLSRLRDEPERFRSYLVYGLQAILTFALPIIALVGVEAPSVVRVLLGSQWVDAVPFFRVLTVAAFALAVARTSNWICLAQVRAERLLRWSLVVRIPILILAALIGARHGALGVAIGLSVAEVGLVVPTIAFNIRWSGVGWRQIFEAVSRPIAVSLIGAGAVFAARGLLPDLPGLSRLASAAALHGVVCGVVWLSLPGGRAVGRRMLTAIRELRPR